MQINDDKLSSTATYTHFKLELKESNFIHVLMHFHIIHHEILTFRPLTLAAMGI